MPSQVIPTISDSEKALLDERFLRLMQTVGGLPRLFDFKITQSLQVPDADASTPGVLTTGSQTIGGSKSFLGILTQADSALVGSPQRRLLHPEVSVLDFGADPTGVLDSQPAFLAAIAAFSAPGHFNAGVVIVPVGTYRLAAPVRIKKPVWIKGEQSPGFGAGVTIVPDPGVTAFVFERYNTPDGTTDSAGSDQGQLSNLLISPTSKSVKWTPSEVVSTGTVRRTGTGVLDDWYRNYTCTQAGQTASSGTGPRSMGSDKVLGYKNQTQAFVREVYVVGGTSGASGLIIEDTGTQLRLTTVRGTFVDNEHLAATLADGVTPAGAATANGGSTVATQDEPDGAARWQYIGGGHGVHIRAFGVSIEGVTVNGCSGNGIHIVGQDLEVPNAFANANNWFLHNISLYSNDGHGVFIQGSDTNDGCALRVICGGGNGGTLTDQNFGGTGYGICDLSLPGNSYVQVHFEAQGRGPVYARNAGGGSSFIGCSLEGDGGGPCIGIGNGIVVGGALAGAYWYDDQFRPSGFTRISPAGGLDGAVNLLNRMNGWSAPSYQQGIAVHVPQGVQKSNNGNIYVATQVGIGLTSGGSGPSGTGNSQVDGTVTWNFVHAETPHGSITLGNADPTYPAFITHQGTRDTNVGLASYYKEGDGGGVTGAAVWQYGISGSSATNDGVGLIHALNGSQLTEWPMTVPAGKPLVEEVWLGGTHLLAGTALPTRGTWNPGDRMYYKGTACVAGGAEGQVCVTGGTFGTYTGGRLVNSNGSAVVTLTGAGMGTLVDQFDFKTGDWVSINGGPKRHVLATSSDGLTLTLDNIVGAGSGLSIAFVHPVFKEFGSIAP